MKQVFDFLCMFVLGCIMAVVMAFLWVASIAIPAAILVIVVIWVIRLIG